MERVQFQQEQMLDELKDLVEKGLFTEKETKQIMKKRTGFETALVRRVAKKEDFLRYASYEMGLEQLRRKRVERLKLPRGPATVSDYALVRRQFQIFERGVKKFKSDVGLWLQYIQVAKKEGARALVGRITARALQLHPNNTSLYILAAMDELDHHSPSAARTLLQRGIRLNPESIEMWTEYVKMELEFVERLRRRWDVLGIKVSNGGESRGLRDTSQAIMAEEEDGVEAEYGGDAGADARRQVMEGAIVESVISNAVKAMPRVELFGSIKEMISGYPSPESLRRKVLDHLHEELRRALPDDGTAVVLYACRFLAPGQSRKEAVEGLRRANEELLARVRAEGRRSEALCEGYARFLEEQCTEDMDESLKEYLVGSVEGAVGCVRKSASLLSVHIRLLGRTDMGPAKCVGMGRKYTARMPGCARVWLARLEAERRHGRGGLAEVWAEARERAVEGTDAELAALESWR